MAHEGRTPRLAPTEEAITVLFCLIDAAYRLLLNPKGQRYEPLKRLSDSTSRDALRWHETGEGLDYTRELFSDYSRYLSMRDRSSVR